jgi:beta-phosphoglucomutase-like phosphatase (HAD superfamily)
MGYEAIIFDLDNTLLNFELCERQAILGALKNCAVYLDLNGIFRFKWSQ